MPEPLRTNSLICTLSQDDLFLTRHFTPKEAPRGLEAPSRLTCGCFRDSGPPSTLQSFLTGAKGPQYRTVLPEESSESSVSLSPTPYHAYASPHWHRGTWDTIHL